MRIFNGVDQEEEARTRGTPVTAESFKAWKLKFDREFAAKKVQEDEDFLKGLTPKEREEWKKAGSRLSGITFLCCSLQHAEATIGRQLFERGGKNLEDDVLLEEGTVSVDIRQYERNRVDEEQEDADGVTFSDSD